MAGKRKTAEVKFSGDIRLDLEHRSFYRLSLLATHINRAIANNYIKNFGRPAHAWKVMTVIGAFGKLSASQINFLTSLEMDKVTRVVDRLVEQGLVTRVQDPDDRRKVVVALSARGKKVNEQIESMIGSMEREFLTVLNRNEREVFYACLDKLQVRAEQVFAKGSVWKDNEN